MTEQQIKNKKYNFSLMKNTREYYTKETVDRILMFIKYHPINNNTDYLLFKLLWETGARISEILALRFIDIDYDNSLIQLITLKRRTDAIRRIPITLSMKNELLTCNKNHNINDKVIRMNYRQVIDLFYKYKNYLAYHKILSKDEVRILHPHVFRHSFAINYIMKGGNIINLQRILGHSSINTTSIYLNIAGIDLKKEFDEVMK